MSKEEFSYFTLFFAFVTALLFSGKDFTLFMFVVAFFCYAVYFVVMYACYRIVKRGWSYVSKILKELYNEVSKAFGRLGNRK